MRDRYGRKIIPIGTRWGRMHARMFNLRNGLRQWWHGSDRLKRAGYWLRWGRITSEILAVDGGHASEVIFRDRFGRCIGYWAYGYWDIDHPYQGQL